MRIAVRADELPPNLLLCRYNIAKHRIREGFFKESPGNGYLIDGLAVPVASTPDEARDLIRARKGQWIEVLVSRSFGPWAVRGCLL